MRRAASRPRAEWADRFVGSDPGLNRFRSALQSVVTIAVALGAEWLFVHLTHALQAPGGAGRITAAQAAANHEYLVIAMLLGAIVAMLSSFGVMDHTAKGQLITLLFLPVPMVAAMAMGLSLGPHRVPALVSLAVVLAVGTYGRRFGPRGFIAGMLLFMGDFFGFFLYGAVTLSDLGWLTAELGVGLVVAMAIRFGLFYPHQAKALARTQRSYAARARKVAALALDRFDNPDHTGRQDRRLAHQLIRLNEAALMIDAQLGDPSALAPGSSGELIHQRLFDIELALTNIARFAAAMPRLDLSADQRSSVRLALLDICEGNLQAAARHARDLAQNLDDLGTAVAGMDRVSVVIPHRFAGSVVDLADATAEWLALGETAAATPATNAAADGVVFEPAVVLNGGWLPGSSLVSASASEERGHRFRDRMTLAPYTRTAVQMGVAVGAAIALGDVVSGKRFYWAAIGAFITFMGANNAGEQIRKALFRVFGTVIGIAAGSGIVDLVGHHTNWSLAVILAALFTGFYLQRINYAFMVIAITIMVSQLYVQLGEFSNEVLLLRLEETALGAAIGIATVMIFLPLRTRRVLGVALRTHIEAISGLVEHATAHLLGPQQATSALRDDARRIDSSYQALIATAQPLRRNLFGNLDERTGQAVRLAGAARNYGRNLVADVYRADPVGVDISVATETLKSSLDVVTAALNGERHGTYTRSSALFALAEADREEPIGTIDGGRLAIRDLKLIDGTMASLAQALGLQVTDYDTVPVESGNGGVRAPLPR